MSLVEEKSGEKTLRPLYFGTLKRLGLDSGQLAQFKSPH